ncbi:hypothetical protein TNCV_3687691 [Trichonephila clavipes]|nr:hypothetical protein TNCV_3687691 [Trichonephila clavipes]
MFDEVGKLYYFLGFFDGGRKLERPFTKLLVVAEIVGFSDTWSASEEKRTSDDKKLCLKACLKVTHKEINQKIKCFPIEPCLTRTLCAQQIVMDTVRRKPNSSERAIVGRSRSSVHRVLQREGLYAHATSKSTATAPHR